MIRTIPHQKWVLFLLRPLNNRYMWKLRLRILLALEPPWFKATRPPIDW